jgi:E3 ubiquitin-protein ligase BRE1
MESRERARVHVRKFYLNESKLEQHVIATNEAEAMTQQRLATAEAEISELGQKLETSKRYLIRVYIHCSVSLLEMQHNNNNNNHQAF